MNPTSALITVAFLLAAALVGGMIAHRLRQPVMLGYLIVGVIVGPHALSLVNDLAIVQASATIGVALLMFTLGLETSVSQLKQAGRVGLWGGIAQILVTFALGMIAGITLFKWSIPQSVLFGLIISLSSTAVCLKILMERGELNSVHGRIMMAILILQDVGAVLMVVMTPLLSESTVNIPLELAQALATAIIFIVAAIAAGLWVLPWLMGRIGGVRSRELFLLTVLVLSLGAALGTQIFGLSMVFGAFIIGLALHESKFAHQALAEVTPLRDIFATLFFVSLGMLLDPRFVIDFWPYILAAIAVIFVIKVGVVFAIVRWFGYDTRIAFVVGAGLFQIGEFGFVLAQGGLYAGIVNEQFYSLIVASAIITMLLTIPSLGLTSRLASIMRQTRIGPIPGATLSSPSGMACGQVVIAGYGRVGQNVAQGLQDAGVTFTIIDIDPERVAAAWSTGKQALYGDASNPNILSKLDLHEIDTLVVTFPDPLAVVGTVRIALQINPQLNVVARVHREGDAEKLKAAGGRVELVNPEYVASIEFIKRTLVLSGWKEAEVEQAMPAVKKDEKFIEFSHDERL